MESIICIITILVINSLFESSLFRVIELFFFYFFVNNETILINYIVRDYKYVFNDYKYILYLLYTL